MSTTNVATATVAPATAMEKFQHVAKDIISKELKQNDAAKLRKLKPLILEVLDGCTEDEVEERKLKIFKAFWESHPEMLECIKKVVRKRKTKDGKLKHNLDEGIFAVKAKVGFLQADLYVSACAEYHQADKPPVSDTRAYDEWLLRNTQQGRSFRYWMNDINNNILEILKEMGVIEASSGRGGKADDATPEETVSKEMTSDDIVKAVAVLDADKQLELLSEMVKSMLIAGVDADAIAGCVEGILVQLPASV